MNATICVMKCVLNFVNSTTWSLTCKNTCSIALGLPPPYLDILNIVSNTRIKKGSAKQSLRCQGEPAVIAFCKHKIHKIMYETIVNHFRNPPESWNCVILNTIVNEIMAVLPKQKTLAVTKGSAPVNIKSYNFEVQYYLVSLIKVKKLGWQRQNLSRTIRLS